MREAINNLNNFFKSFNENQNFSLKLLNNVDNLNDISLNYCNDMQILLENFMALEKNIQKKGKKIEKIKTEKDLIKEKNEKDSLEITNLKNENEKLSKKNKEKLKKAKEELENIETEKKKLEKNLEIFQTTMELLKKEKDRLETENKQKLEEKNYEISKMNDDFKQQKQILDEKVQKDEDEIYKRRGLEKYMKEQQMLLWNKKIQSHLKELYEIKQFLKREEQEKKKFQRLNSDLSEEIKNLKIDMVKISYKFEQATKEIDNYEKEKKKNIAILLEKEKEINKINEEFELIKNLYEDLKATNNKSKKK